MNIKVDDQGAEREPEPITADVTGSMRRGLAYDPADMTGPAVSVASRDAAHQARMDALRLHLEQTHCNLAAAGLTNRDAVEYHHHEHNGPGGLRLHDQPEQLHDWAWFGGVRSAVSVEHVGLPSPDAHAIAASADPVLTAEEMAIHRRRLIDRIAITNPDDVAQPGALTRIEILVGQLKYLDADGLAALADAIRDRQDADAVANYHDPAPMLRSELTRILANRRDTFVYVYVPVVGRRPVRLGINSVAYVPAHDHIALRTVPWFLDPPASHDGATESGEATA